MPKLTHPLTGATWDVPDAAVRYWTGPGGWHLADAQVTRPAGKARRRRSRAAAPKTTPAPDAGAQDDDPGLGASTTEPTKE